MSSELTVPDKHPQRIRIFCHRVSVDWDLTMVGEVVEPAFRSHDWPEGVGCDPQALRAFNADTLESSPDTRW